MDALQADIEGLEQEKADLREKVKDLSRKTLMEGIVRQSTTAGQQTCKVFEAPADLRLCGSCDGLVCVFISVCARVCDEVSTEIQKPQIPKKHTCDDFFLNEARSAIWRKNG